GTFLIDDGQALALIDTGMGDTGGPGGRLLERLEGAGVAPSDISLVIHTHLHSDHVGWNCVDADGLRRLVFTRARHVVQRADWAHFSEHRAKHPAFEACVEPVRAAGRLELLDGDVPVTGSLSVIRTPGHTPGHQSVVIRSEGAGAIILGDVAHLPLQLWH